MRKQIANCFTTKSYVIWCNLMNNGMGINSVTEDNYEKIELAVTNCLTIKRAYGIKATNSYCPDVSTFAEFSLTTQTRTSFVSVLSNIFERSSQIMEKRDRGID